MISGPVPRTAVARAAAIPTAVVVTIVTTTTLPARRPIPAMIIAIAARALAFGIDQTLVLVAETTNLVLQIDYPLELRGLATLGRPGHATTTSVSTRPQAPRISVVPAVGTVAWCALLRRRTAEPCRQALQKLAQHRSVLVSAHEDLEGLGELRELRDDVLQRDAHPRDTLQVPPELIAGLVRCASTPS